MKLRSFDKKSLRDCKDSRREAPTLRAMRTPSIAIAFAVFACVGLTAQTPAPSQSAGRPLRHLQYSFSTSYSGVSEYHYTGIGDSSSGVGGSADSEGGRGTDRAIEVPDAIHDELQVVGDDGSGHGTYDFHLISDSFAKRDKS